jgi:hypothetical protein
MWDIQRPLGQIYDYAKFTLTNGQTDYDVKLNQANLFKYIKIARIVVIENDQDITVKFNDTSYQSVDVDIADGRLELTDKIFVGNIYLSNSSGSDAVIKIWLFN